MVRSDRSLWLLLVCIACTPSGGATHSARAVESHPFRNRDGLILLAARVGDDEERTFVLDTGASPCVVDSAFATSAGIASVASTQAGQGGAGAFTPSVTANPISVHIGGQTLPCRETFLLDLNGLTDVIGERIAGIIGGDFFRGRIVRVDFDRSTVSVFRRGEYKPDSSTKIPIRIDRNRPYLTALLSIPGRDAVSRELLIDTGSRDNVDDRLLKESSQGVRAVNPTGVGSGATAFAGTFSEVRIGQHIFHDLPGVAGNVSIVGAGVLANFNLVFDYDGGWIALQQRRISAN